MRFLLSHWRGSLPLYISLWVNLVGLTLLLSSVELFMISGLMSFPEQLLRATIISLFVTRLIIFPWQLVGLLRAAESDFVENRNILRTRAVQAMGLLSILFTLVYSLEVIQGVLSYKQQLAFYAQPAAAPEYALKLGKNRHQLEISGGLDYGITDEVESLIETYPGIESVILSSRGGQIYEGRGLARVFIEHQLDTYVVEECSSACTTAFIGGRKRHLAPQGKLGFHQYKVDLSRFKKAVAFFDPGVEQVRDMELFRQRGVDPVFLDKMFQQSAEGIWFPEHSELLQAHIVHTILP